jgi:hypothetical protein
MAARLRASSISRGACPKSNIPIAYLGPMSGRGASMQRHIYVVSHRKVNQPVM